MARIVITGATGTVGSAALQQALLRKDISEVVVLGRSEPFITDPKIRFLKHEDFSTLPSSLVDQLKDCKGVCWCMGLPSMGNTKEQWLKVHCDFALVGAKAFASTGSKPNFVYISGAASKWGSTWHWIARALSETEQALVNTEGLDAVVIRSPSVRPATDKPKLHWADKTARFLGPVLTAVAPSFILDADQLGKVIVDIAVNGPMAGKGGRLESGIYIGGDVKAEAERLSRAS